MLRDKWTLLRVQNKNYLNNLWNIDPNRVVLLEDLNVVMVPDHIYSNFCVKEHNEYKKDECILALVKELKEHWTHPANPCLCSKCQIFTRYKALISEVEYREMKRIQNELKAR
jgi:hypothetical protein